MEDPRLGLATFLVIDIMWLQLLAWLPYHPYDTDVETVEIIISNENLATNKESQSSDVDKIVKKEYMRSP